MKKIGYIAMALYMLLVLFLVYFARTSKDLQDQSVKDIREHEQELQLKKSTQYRMVKQVCATEEEIAKMHKVYEGQEITVESTCGWVEVGEI